jgi:hypothetical protein
MRYLSKDIPGEVVSDRINVGQDTLDKHYDKRTQEQRVKQRRGYLEDV